MAQVTGHLSPPGWMKEQAERLSFAGRAESKRERPSASRRDTVLRMDNSLVDHGRNTSNPAPLVGGPAEHMEESAEHMEVVAVQLLQVVENNKDTAK